MYMYIYTYIFTLHIHIYIHIHKYTYIYVHTYDGLIVVKNLNGQQTDTLRKNIIQLFKIFVSKLKSKQI